MFNQVFTSGFFDSIMPYLSDFGFWLVPLGLSWIVFFLKTDKRGKIIALGCFVVISATDQISANVIKPLVKRDRPCNVVPSTHFYDVDQASWIYTDKFGLTTYKPSHSFPSNHAANMAGQAVYWSYFYPQISPVFIIAALAVGYSRIYLGHHWPTDVAAGYLIGLILALAIAYPIRVWALPET